MEKPSLNDIAAMPYPASMLAMREHYVKDWGKPVPGDGTMQSYKVVLHYSYTVDEKAVFTVDAFSEDEALDAAEALLAKECTEHFDINDAEFKVLSA